MALRNEPFLCPKIVTDFDEVFLIQSITSFTNYYNVVMTDSFPPIEGGGSLILAWQIKNKHVLVVGGGEVCICPTNATAMTLMK